MSSRFSEFFRNLFSRAALNRSGKEFTLKYGFPWVPADFFRAR
jgi:hypothetical protein